MVRPPYEFQFFLLKAYFIIIFSKSSCPSQGVTLSLLVVQACVLGRSVVSDSATQGLSPARLLHPWDSPGKNPGAGCHSLLQGIFATPESNPCLLQPLHWQMDSLPLNHLGNPIDSGQKCQSNIISVTFNRTKTALFTQALVTTPREFGRAPWQPVSARIPALWAGFRPTRTGLQTHPPSIQRWAAILLQQRTAWGPGSRVPAALLGAVTVQSP